LKKKQHRGLIQARWIPQKSEMASAPPHFRLN